MDREKDVAEYRIDDLARAAGTTVRNVRVYQARGLLAAPRLVGRVGWYSDAHLTRLRLIGRLLARGYTFAVMKELLEAWEAGGDLADVLGLEAALVRPWTDETPVPMSRAELREAYGDAASEPMIERSVSLGLLERHGDDFLVPNPGVFAAGAELIAFGVPIADVLDVAQGLYADLSDVASRFVELLRERVLPNDAIPPAEQVPEVVAAIERLRPMALSAVSSIFATAMQDQIADALGKAAQRSAHRHDVAREQPPSPKAV